MNDQTRRAVAFLVLKQFAATADSIYDVDALKRFQFFGEAGLDKASFIDQDAGTSYAGSGNGKSIVLYNEKAQKHLVVGVTGTRFDGYDYETAKHYVGAVLSGDRVHLYDYSTARFHDFTP